MLKNIFLLLFSLLATAELAVRITKLDYLLMQPLLYYQDSDLSVQEVSPNPERLYQLKPGATTSTMQYSHSASINGLGFRGTEHAATKPPGVTRIICFGGSTTYGAFVDDNGTFPYYLEKILNRHYRGKFEVWNAGICAYVLSAEVAYARETLQKFEPDILIFQHANQGRRAFHLGAPYAHFFRANPQLYRENLRFMPFPKSEPAFWLLRHSAAYRASVVLANCFLFVRQNNPQYNGDDYNHAAFASFYTEYAGRVPIFILPLKMIQDYPSPQFSEMVKKTGVPLLELFDQNSLPPNAGSEYYMVHPPAHVYEWYGRAIAGKLETRGLVKRK